MSPNRAPRQGGRSVSAPSLLRPAGTGALGSPSTVDEPQPSDDHEHGVDSGEGLGDLRGRAERALFHRARGLRADPGLLLDHVDDEPVEAVEFDVGGRDGQPLLVGNLPAREVGAAEFDGVMVDLSRPEVPDTVDG